MPLLLAVRQSVEELLGTGIARECLSKVRWHLDLARLSVELEAHIHDIASGYAGVAQKLPSPLGAELLDSAREAFIQGMRVSSAIATVVAIGISILAVTMLRNVRSGSETEADEAGSAREAGSTDRLVVAE